MRQTSCAMRQESRSKRTLPPATSCQSIGTSRTVQPLSISAAGNSTSKANAQPRRHRLVGRARHQLQAALGIVHRDGQQFRHQGGKDAAEQMALEQAVDPAAEQLDPRGKQGRPGLALSRGQAGETRHLGGAARAVGIDKTQPGFALVRRPTGINRAPLAKVLRQFQQRPQAGMARPQALDQRAHSRRLRRPGTIIDHQNTRALDPVERCAQLRQEHRQSRAFAIAGNDEMQASHASPSRLSRRSSRRSASSVSASSRCRA